MTAPSYNYQSIYAAVYEELNRTDLSVSTVNHFIRQAEKSLYRSLRIPPNLKKVTGEVTLPDWRPELSPGVPNTNYRPYDASGFGVPTDYLEAYLMTDGDGNFVERISAQEFRKQRRWASARPKYFTEEAGQFLFQPSYEGNFFFMYYFEPPPLSTDDPVNEVSHVIGEAIQYAATANGWRYLRDPDKHRYFQELANTVYQEVTNQWRKQETSGGTMISKNPYL